MIHLPVIPSASSSPPAFSWDHWYASVGGRSIKIDEADAILKYIYEQQYPRFHGPVASVKKEFNNPLDAANQIKMQALALGADMVGICRIEPTDVYQGKVVHEKFAIALGQRMQYSKFVSVPAEESAVECLRIYQSLGEVVIALAAYIRSLGYTCEIEHPIGDSNLLHIPIGLKAGFGELGRHGSIIHPKFGPLFRMGSVATSIEMACDKPIDAGIAAFCDSCRACRIYCPANAIPDERSANAGKDHLGNNRYVVDTGKCFPYFAKHNYCSACLPVCVYNHKEWAKDFDTGNTLSFPTVNFEVPPAPSDPNCDGKVHQYNKLGRHGNPPQKVLKRNYKR